MEKKSQERNILKKLNDFFKFNSSDSGSRERLLELIRNFQNDSQKSPLFLIAGSWAIELISKKELDHDDIDLIVLTKPPYYIDDAEEIEEKCFNIIPLSLDYFKKNCFESSLNEIKTYIPNHNLQICLKLIGQLQENLPERAIEQLRCLLDSYKLFKEKESEKEIAYILRNLIPNEINSDVVAKDVVCALKEYFSGEKTSSMKEFVRLHSLINKALRYQFEKRRLTDKIPISNK